MAALLLNNNKLEFAKTPQRRASTTKCQNETLRNAIQELERSFIRQLKKIKALVGGGEIVNEASGKGLTQAGGPGSRQELDKAWGEDDAPTGHTCPTCGMLTKRELAESDDSSQLLSDWDIKNGGRSQKLLEWSDTFGGGSCSFGQVLPSTGKIENANSKDSIKSDKYDNLKKKKMLNPDLHVKIPLTVTPKFYKKRKGGAKRKTRAKTGMNYNLRDVSWARKEEIKKDKKVGKKQRLEIHKEINSPKKTPLFRPVGKQFGEELRGEPSYNSDESMSLLELSERKVANRVLKYGADSPSWHNNLLWDTKEDSWDSSPSSGFLVVETSPSKQLLSQSKLRRRYVSSPKVSSGSSQGFRTGSRKPRRPLVRRVNSRSGYLSPKKYKGVRRNNSTTKTKRSSFKVLPKHNVSTHLHLPKTPDVKRKSQQL